MKEKLDFLWEEYKYRHDLCWRTVTQLTLTSTFLVALPYLNENVSRALGRTILFLPFLAIVLVTFGWLMMARELSRLDRVKREYRWLQDKYLDDQKREAASQADKGFWSRWILSRWVRSHDQTKIRFDFTDRVLTYLAILLLLGVVSLFVTAFTWLPHLADTATPPECSPCRSAA